MKVSIDTALWRRGPWCLFWWPNSKAAITGSKHIKTKCIGGSDFKYDKSRSMHLKNQQIYDYNNIRIRFVDRHLNYNNKKIQW